MASGGISRRTRRSHSGVGKRSPASQADGRKFPPDRAVIPPMLSPTLRSPVNAFKANNFFTVYNLRDLTFQIATLTEWPLLGSLRNLTYPPPPKSETNTSHPSSRRSPSTYPTLKMPRLLAITSSISDCSPRRRKKIQNGTTAARSSAPRRQSFARARARTAAR